MNYDTYEWANSEGLMEEAGVPSKGLGIFGMISRDKWEQLQHEGRDAWSICLGTEVHYFKLLQT